MIYLLKSIKHGDLQQICLTLLDDQRVLFYGPPTSQTCGFGSETAADPVRFAPPDARNGGRGAQWADPGGVVIRLYM